MEVSTSLLVVLMFNAVVGIGIGNILMTFAGQVSNMAVIRGRKLAAAWLLIMLLAYMSMFWNSTLIVERSDWNYGLFLLVIAGPVVLLFASSLMARILGEELTDTSTPMARSLLRRFFALYACVQIWFVGMDLLLFDEWLLSTTLSVGLAGSALLLGYTGDQKAVWVFTALILVLTISEAVLKS